MDTQSIQSIQGLMNEYCYTVDSGEFDKMAALFEHGSFEFKDDPESVLSGTVAMRSMLDSVSLYDGKPLTKHVMSNVQITVDEANNSAKAQCYITVFQAVPDKFPLQAIFIGHYSDSFERVDSTWRFKQRSISGDLAGDISFHRADMA